MRANELDASKANGHQKNKPAPGRWGHARKPSRPARSRPARSTVVLDRPSRGSAVIGGDTPTADELTKSKQRAAKKTAKKAGGKRGGVKKSTRSSAGGGAESEGVAAVREVVAVALAARRNRAKARVTSNDHQETQTFVSTMSQLHAQYYADRLVQADATIERQDLIGEETFRLRAAVPEIAAAVVPGQFVMIRLAGTDAPLIGRALAVYDVIRDEAGNHAGSIWSTSAKAR